MNQGQTVSAPPPVGQVPNSTSRDGRAPFLTGSNGRGVMAEITAMFHPEPAPLRSTDRCEATPT